MSKLLARPETELETAATGCPPSTAAATGKFRKLLDTFCTQLSKEGLKILCTFCEQSGLLAETQQISVESGLHTAHVLSVLVDHKLVTEDNLQLLYFAARSCGQTEILEAVTHFAESQPALTQSLPPDFEQHCPNVPGHTPVKFVAQCSAKDMDRDNILSLCRFLADISGIEYHQVAWQGLRENTTGRVEMMALLPSKSLSTLQVRLDRGDNTLELVGIEDIHILQNAARMETELNAALTPMQELLKQRIGEGQAPSASEILDAIHPSTSQETIDLLLCHAAKHNNAAAIDELAQVVMFNKSTEHNDTIIDVMAAKGIQIGLKLLPNAYAAERVELVRSLIDRGFFLHPSIEPYTALLFAVCQNPNYPLTLLKMLLDSEDTISCPYGDSRKEDVYEQCLISCCLNDNDHLVELFVRRQAPLSKETLDRYSSCVGRAMSRVGSSYRTVCSSSWLVRHVEVSWQNMGLLSVSHHWLGKDNLRGLLVKLDVSFNQLSSIPSCLLDGSLPALEEVNCSENKLTSLWNDDQESTSADKCRLKIFNASKNELQELPLYVFQLPFLETLNVSHNMLTSLPGPDIVMETSSTSGDSDSNELIESYWLCTRLVYLDASHNRLRQLPETFGHVLHLRKLNVAHNEISLIPRSLSTARLLELVDLSSNCVGLAADPNNLSCLPKSVQKLSLSSNNLGCIPKAVLSITSLRQLDCADNFIVSLPYKQQWQLPHLEALILRKNNLTMIGDSIFPDSFGKSLAHLDLSHNQLKKFPDAVLGLKMVVSLNFEGNPRVDTLPPAIATLRRLWEVKVDDMKKAVREFQPAVNGQVESEGSHYSKVKQLISDKFYDYDLYYGIKMSVIGSQIARDCVIRGLHYQPGQEDIFHAQLPVVSTLILRSESNPTPLGELTQWLPTWLNKDARTKPKDTTVKMWNIADDRSLVVLQQVFFKENTVHLLVFHESDGQSGLDQLLRTLLLLNTNSMSIRTVLVVLSTKPLLPAIQERIDKLETTTDLHCTINVNIRAQKTVIPLPDEISKFAEELASVGDNFRGDNNSRVPAAFRSAATKLFLPDTAIKTSVCTRNYILKCVFPDGFNDPDDFVQVMRFFMRIGALLHFEDTPRNLHEYFFTDIDLVSRVLVTLTSGRCSHLDSGVAHARHIYAVLNRLSGSEANSNALFALLVKLGVVGPLDCCHCLLPFRLSFVRNGLKLGLSQYLTPRDGESCSAAPTYVRRLYSMGGLPPSFWGRFIGALLLQMQRVLDSLETTDEHQPKTNAVFWASGIMAHYSEGFFVVSAVTEDDSSENTIQMECSKRCIGNGLDIVVFDRRRHFVALGLICSLIERLLQEWIDSSDEDSSSLSSATATVLSVERLVPCPPFSFDARHSQDEILYDFIFEHAIPEEAKLCTLEECVRSTDNPNLLLLIPDLTLASLSSGERFRIDDVTMDTTSGSVGEGSFGSVFSAYLGNEKVALKVFADVDLLVGNDNELKGNVFDLKGTGPRRPSLSSGLSQMRRSSIRDIDSAVDAEESGEDATILERADTTNFPERQPSGYFKHLQDLVQEVAVMKQLQHKNIVKFRGVLFEPYPCLILEYAPGGNLAMLISRRRDEIGTVSDLLTGVCFSGAAHDGIMGRELTHRIAFQIASGIEYLHSKTICHLDLKPENVLVWSESVTAEVNVKLTDYGISCTIPAAGVNNARGTLGYQAPEQILSRRNRGESFDLRVDIYAYGTMLYYLLTGVHPFESDMDKPSMVEHKIRQNDHPSLPTGQSLIYLQILIDRCWRYWPGERPSAGQIVAEMCYPAFQLQCEDLTVNGTHKVLASAVVTDDSQRPANETANAGAIKMLEKDFCRVSPTWGLTKRVRSTQRAQAKRALSLPATSYCSPDTSVDSKLVPQSLWSQRSLSSETSNQIDADPQSQGTATGTDKQDTQAGTLQYDASQISHTSPSTAMKCEDENELGNDIQKCSFSLVATNDSLLITDPNLSRFLSAQKIEIREGDVSSILFLNDKLWVGLRSKELCVYDCIGSEIVRRIKQQRFGCNDVVEDLQCQISEDRTYAKVFAMLANGDILVVSGHRYTKKSAGTRKLIEWGSDSVYRWNQPEVRRVGKTGVNDDEAPHVKCCMVLPRQGELWYCQGSSIVVLDTTKSPEEIVWMDDSAAGDISVPDIAIIKHATVLGDSVWCCGGISSNTLCEIDIRSRRPIKNWTLNELRSQNEATSHPSSLAGSYVAYRWCPWQRLAMCPPQAIQSIAGVCDTLWVSCDNGAILVMCKDGEKELRVLTTLWCRPVLKHVLSQKRAVLPTVKIAKMSQVGDRVLVYIQTLSADEKNDENTVVAEVFEALNSSQLKILIAYYDIHRT